MKPSDLAMLPSDTIGLRHLLCFLIDLHRRSYTWSDRLHPNDSPRNSSSLSWKRNRNPKPSPNTIPHLVYTVRCVFGVWELELETFRHYIMQDVYFLRAFAPAYEMAEECADDNDAKMSISELRKAVLEEMKMHDAIVELPEERKLDLLKSLAECSPYTTPQDSRQLLPSVVRLLKTPNAIYE